MGEAGPQRAGGFMSECGCIYTGVDSYAPETATIRMARKVHRCCECRQPIEPGQRYEVRAHFEDGSVSTYKTCLSCAEIRNTFFCEGWYYGSVWSDIESAMFDAGRLNSACLDRLSTVEAKQMLQRKWMDWVNRRTALSGPA